MTYSIKKIAELAGVSTRAIRYYDEIGLLIPPEIGANGYRYYDKESLMRLQQILFYRELDIPLKEIQRILGDPGFDTLKALQVHRASLSAKVKQLKELINTVDKTIETTKGKRLMTNKEIFKGFDEKKYADEARERWGNSPKFTQSQKRWAGFSKEEKESIKAEGGEITRRMVGTDPDLTPEDPSVQEAVGEYLAYVNKYFYTCDVESLRGLAVGWVQDERFAINYDRIREGGAKFVREAVHTFCDRKQKG